MIRVTLHKPRRADTDVEQLRHVSDTLTTHQTLQPTDTQQPLLDEVTARTARVSSQPVHHGVSHTTTRPARSRTPRTHGTRPLRHA